MVSVYSTPSSNIGKQHCSHSPFSSFSSYVSHRHALHDQSDSLTTLQRVEQRRSCGLTTCLCSRALSGIFNVAVAQPTAQTDAGLLDWDIGPLVADTCTDAICMQSLTSHCRFFSFSHRFGGVGIGQQDHRRDRRVEQRFNLHGLDSAVTSQWTDCARTGAEQRAASAAAVQRSRSVQ